MEQEQGKREGRVVQVQLVVELADVSVPGVREAPEPDEQLRDPGQHVGALGQYLVETRHCRIYHETDWGGDAVVLVYSSPWIVVAEWGVGNEVLGLLGQRV